MHASLIAVPALLACHIRSTRQLSKPGPKLLRCNAAFPRFKPLDRAPRGRAPRLEIEKCGGQCSVGVADAAVVAALDLDGVSLGQRYVGAAHGVAVAKRQAGMAAQHEDDVVVVVCAALRLLLAAHELEHAPLDAGDVADVHFALAGAALGEPVFLVLGSVC